MSAYKAGTDGINAKSEHGAYKAAIPMHIVQYLGS